MKRVKTTGAVLAGLAMSTAGLVGASAAPAAAGQSLVQPRAVNGYYQIVNPSTGKCADVKDASSSPGALLQQWDCKNITAQRWALRDLGNGYYNLVNQNSSQCLNVVDFDSTNGTRIEQWPCLGFSSQEWKLTLLSTTPQATYALTDHNSGKCLDLQSDWPSNGTRLQIWDCYLGIPAQSWAFQ
ncbi:RICIN domain-containing protein [Kitasatospora cinereorecta]|uniref:RICIN domain-containing protein n=1 Tax=Kitasatospora cinereorecta TaxID=285560 RepID=A0ABW0VLE5_9ACTN